MHLKKVTKLVLLLLCSISVAVFYYCLTVSRPDEIDYGREYATKSRSETIKDLKDLLMWLRSVDFTLDERAALGEAFTLNKFDTLDWTKKKNGVKMLIKWVQERIAVEEKRGKCENSSHVHVDPTLRLLEEAAQRKLADDSPVIAVLVLACDRVSVGRCLDQLLKYRPSQHQFPIVVSRDCEHNETAEVIASFHDRNVFSVRQPDQSPVDVPPKLQHLEGYYRVGRHYRWLLNLVFETVGFDSVIIVEDDIDVAPDFFEYFAATRKLLAQDPSLWCVSAWNDNGKAQLVDLEAGSLIHRTDFFPGLGWMLTHSEWDRFARQWPSVYWDDWLREPEQRNGRACLRPEISRTRVFEGYGVSRGFHYQQHIGQVVLSKHVVPFTQLRLDHLIKENYDPVFNSNVSFSPLVTKEQLLRGNLSISGPVRITYGSQHDFKVVARAFNLMDDAKSGVPRTAYHGVVSFMHRGVRVYLAPKYAWKGYSTHWT